MSTHCEICNGIGYHKIGCPNYSNPDPIGTCALCGEPIEVWEEYVVNEDDDKAHRDCSSTNELIHWLGGEIIYPD